MPTETIATYDAPGAAYLAKTRLEAAGIQSAIVGEDMAHLTSFFSPNAHRIELRVEAADAEEARTILEDDVQE